MGAIAHASQGISRVHLVCGGRYHAFNFVQQRLTSIIEELGGIDVSVSDSYDAASAAGWATDLLLTYTCDLRPTLSTQLQLRAWIEGGGRWFALHGTNAVLDLVVDPSGSKLAVPRLLQPMAETLGSHFLAHPPIGEIAVSAADSRHPLVERLAPFSTTDELFLSEFHAEVETLLQARFSGEALEDFPHRYWPEEQIHPVMYIRRFGLGSVLYLTLGHCSSPGDPEGKSNQPPAVMGSWVTNQYVELIRRGIAWMLSRQLGA
jgi:uncharacterized protein